MGGLVTTVFESTKITFGRVDPAVLTLLTGGELPEPSGMTLEVWTEVSPFTPPRKARRLTGKRYRAARRAWRRDERRYRRGLVPGRTRRTVLHNVRPTEVEPVGQRTFSVGFEAQS